jgi:hypothetical protein
MLVHHLLLVTTDHLMAAGFLQTVRRAVVAFLAMVFGVGLLAGGLLGFSSAGRWAAGGDLIATLSDRPARGSSLCRRAGHRGYRTAHNALFSR